MVTVFGADWPGKDGSRNALELRPTRQQLALKLADEFAVRDVADEDDSTHRLLPPFAAELKAQQRRPHGEPLSPEQPASRPPSAAASCSALTRERQAQATTLK